MKTLIKVSSWVEMAHYARPIRTKVFVEEQQVPISEEWDEWDDLALHAVAWIPAKHEMDSPLAIATARLLPSNLLQSEQNHPAQLSTCSIGRMAVLPTWRGRGVGRQLLQTLIAKAQQRGDAVVTIHAQTHALKFYAAFGFTIQGDEFMEAGIPHYQMQLRLPTELPT